MTAAARDEPVHDETYLPREDDAECAVGGSEWASLLDGEGAGEGLECGSDEAQGIEVQFHLGPR